MKALQKSARMKIRVFAERRISAKMFTQDSHANLSISITDVKIETLAPSVTQAENAMIGEKEENVTEELVADTDTLRVLQILRKNLSNKRIF